METRQQTRKTGIGIILLPAFNAFATVGFVDPFRATNYLGGEHQYWWRYISLDGGLVQASNGMEINSISLDEAEGLNFDMVFVSASWTPEQWQDRRLFNALRSWARIPIPLGGLDTGAFLLGFAGLMRGYRGTVHYEHIDSFGELFPNVDVSEDLFVFDRDRITCCGGAATTDLALEMIRSAHGLDAANFAARYIFHERMRSGTEGQNPGDIQPVNADVPTKLRDAILLMERNMEEPITIPEISDRLNLSQRQMERLFKSHTGVSALRYYLDVRLDRARSLTTQTHMSLLEISVACGFGSTAHFGRAYKKRFGMTPKQDRIAGRIPFEFRAYPSHRLHQHAGQVTEIIEVPIASKDQSYSPGSSHED